ncbi:MAG TPA: hypothetical protein VNX21_09050 [Candidatus Thermoplasmatota archaeon]|nr:hypothetical protein [Candidatus Thermoplasmatota archaeon]
MPVLSGTMAVVAAVAVVIVVLLLWKFLKFAFKIAVLVAAAVLLYLILRWAGVLWTGPAAPFRRP